MRMMHAVMLADYNSGHKYGHLKCAQMLKLQMKHFLQVPNETIKRITMLKKHPQTSRQATILCVSISIHPDAVGSTINSDCRTVPLCAIWNKHKIREGKKCSSNTNPILHCTHFLSPLASFHKNILLTQFIVMERRRGCHLLKLVKISDCWVLKPFRNFSDDC